VGYLGSGTTNYRHPVPRYFVFPLASAAYPSSSPRAETSHAEASEPDTLERVDAAPRWDPRWSRRPKTHDGRMELNVTRDKHVDPTAVSSFPGHNVKCDESRATGESDADGKAD